MLGTQDEPADERAAVLLVRGEQSEVAAPLFVRRVAVQLDQQGGKPVLLPVPGSRDPGTGEGQFFVIAMSCEEPFGNPAMSAAETERLPGCPSAAQPWCCQEPFAKRTSW